MSEWPLFLIERDAQIFALQVAIGGVLLSAIVLLAARVLRRQSAPLRYGVLFAGVVGLLTVPAFVGVGQRFQGTLLAVETPTEEIVRIPVERLGEFLTDGEPEAPPTAVAPSPSEPVGPLLLLGWALGSVLGLSRLMRAMRMQRRVLIGTPWQTAWWTDQRQARLAQAVGLRQFPEVFASPAAPMPLVFGLFRPRIVLPEQAPSSWGQSQWEAVLLHEAAHIARRDPWAALVQQIGVILFWWCPLVHLLARRLNQLREQICDDYALQGACDGIAYAEVLIESAECLVRLKAVPVPIGLLDSARGGLEDRITRLLQKEREPMTKLSWPGKLLGAACLVMACLLISAATAFSGGPTPSPKKIQIKIIVDGKEIDLSDMQIKGIFDALPQKPQAEQRPGGVIAPVQPPAPVKLDPRIEELVRQAEAIKPGAGAEVRRALQGKAAGPLVTWRVVDGLRPGMAPNAIQGGPGIGVGGPVPSPGGPAPGKKIIVLEIRDGKVVQLQADFDCPAMKEALRSIQNGKATQLQDQDLKVLLERGIHSGRGPSLTPPKPEPTTPEAAPAADPFKRVPALPADPTSRYPILPTTNDTEAVLRQLDRINAELQVLRQRLNDAKKVQGR